MSVETDPAFYSSNYERFANDSYYTEPSVTGALARRLPKYVDNIWEPSAGRGDMARVFIDNGFNAFCTDINADPFDQGLAPFETLDFLSGNLPGFYVEEKLDAICGNPPFGDLAEAFVRRALAFEDIGFTAFVLRSEWKHGSSRRDLFGNAHKGQKAQPYAMEIVLTWRPRWDWWLPEEQRYKIVKGKKVKMSPRHNFSIFCWDRAHQGPPIQQFATRKN